MTTRESDRLRALKRAHATTPTAGPTPRVEDYVEVIYELILEKGSAQIVDISSHLSVSAPTATKMIQKLSEEGLVAYTRYRAVSLTPEGTELAKKVRHRHGILASFLRLLGIDEAASHRATEGIEHHLDAATLSRIAELVEYANAHPEWWAQQRKK